MLEKHMVKNPNAQALGRLGGLKGGAARFKALTKKQLIDAARKAGIASGAARRRKKRLDKTAHVR